LLSKRIFVPKQTHVIFKALQLVKGSLGLPVPEDSAQLAFPISIPDLADTEALRAVAGTNGNYAILNPGGGWPTKLWSPERFGRLADALWAYCGLHPIVTYGPGEQDLGEAVRDSF